MINNLNVKHYKIRIRISDTKEADGHLENRIYIYDEK